SFLALEADPGRAHSIRGAVSADGFHWNVLPDALSVEASDTQLVGYYDQQLQKYVIFTRSYMVGSRAESFENPTERRHAFVPRRSIGRTESTDFQSFPLSQTIIQPEAFRAPTDTFYTNSRTSIPGAPDHHLMFPA